MESLALQRTIAHWYRIVDSLWGLAAATGQREPARAATLFGAEAAVRSATTAPLRLIDPDRHEEPIQSLRQRMEPAAFAAAWQAGFAMGREEALTYALGERGRKD
jgi:hypothetical protein